MTGKQKHWDPKCMHKKRIAFGFLLVLTAMVLGEKCPTRQFILDAAGTPIQRVPLSIDLEGIDYPANQTTFCLFRLEGNKKTPLPCQFENAHTARLWFIPDRVIAPKEKITLELLFEQPQISPSPILAMHNDKTITLKSGDKNILQYYHAVCPVPEGVNPLFQRSGFIHPVWSPEGNILTRIQPPDHYHHYGIWNPWTKVHIEGKEVDFWNLGDNKGLVRFAGLLSTVSGPVYAGFKVRHEHVATNPGDTEKIAIQEVWDVRACISQIGNQPVWIADFTCVLNNAMDQSIELAAYRYGGGIGFRATEDWTAQNSIVQTSEGKSRKDADGSRARWCDVSGANAKNQRSGIVFLSHAANRDHPEPMRVWPENMNDGRGDMFFEFCPIRDNAWVLEPDREYTLRYRMIIYDGAVAPEMSENLWKNFTHPPRATLQKADLQ